MSQVNRHPLLQFKPDLIIPLVSSSSKSDYYTQDNYQQISPKVQKAAYLTIFGAFCINLVNGTCFLWGTICCYVISYFHWKGDPSATLSNGCLILPLNIVFSGLMFPIGAWMQKRYNPKLIILLGSGTMLVSLFAASFAQRWSTFVILFGVVMPIGMGLQNLTPIMCAWEWFPQNRGFVSGLLTCAWGIGAFIFSYIMTFMANPDNAKPEIPLDNVGDNLDMLFPKHVSERVPLMFRFCILI